MGRPNCPRFRTRPRRSIGSWWMTVHGKQVDLKIYTPPPEGYEEAVREGERLKAEMAKGAVPVKIPASTPPPPAPEAPTVADEVERYRAEVFTRKPPATQQAYHHRLNWIVTHFGRVVVSDLTPSAVELAVEKKPGWGDSTRRLTLSVMQLLVRWSGRKEFTLLKPSGGMRDERCVLRTDRRARSPRPGRAVRWSPAACSRPAARARNGYPWAIARVDISASCAAQKGCAAPRSAPSRNAPSHPARDENCRIRQFENTASVCVVGPKGVVTVDRVG